MNKKFLRLALVAISTIGIFGLSSAQQITGTPGTPGATTTMFEYRYEPSFKFTGKIDELTFKLEPEPKAAAKP